LDVDFSADSYHKVGPAAIGQTATDYWNIYSRDMGSPSVWRDSGQLTGLKWADDQAHHGSERDERGRGLGQRIDRPHVLRQGWLSDRSDVVTPSSLTFDQAGRLWITEATFTGFTTTAVGAHRVRILDLDQVVRTVAGSAEPGLADGPGASARFSGPHKVALDHLGTLCSR